MFDHFEGLAPKGLKTAAIHCAIDESPSGIQYKMVKSSKAKPKLHFRLIAQML